MHRDKKVGLALAILLCSIVGAFFFRDNALGTTGQSCRTQTNSIKRSRTSTADRTRTRTLELAETIRDVRPNDLAVVSIQTTCQIFSETIRPPALEPLNATA